jgi:hypothetical protein
MRAGKPGWISSFAGLALLLAASAVQAQDRAVPAELPPPDFRGQQYVDSKGCLFLRAGEGTATVWVPRVTRKGGAICGDPALRGRASDPQAAQDALDGADGYHVEVGRFSRKAKADKAVVQIEALGFQVASKQVMGLIGPQFVVFAGPFDAAAAAEAAQDALLDAGFSDATVTRL